MTLTLNTAAQDSTAALVASERSRRQKLSIAAKSRVRGIRGRFVAIAPQPDDADDLVPDHKFWVGLLFGVVGTLAIVWAVGMLAPLVVGVIGG